MVKCSANDLICSENINTDDSPMLEYSGSYTYMARSPLYYENENDINSGGMDDVNHEIQNEELLPDLEYLQDMNKSLKMLGKKEKRSIELVEERPPEGTYSGPSDIEETPTTREIPSISSKPSIPSMSSMPSMPSIPSMPQPPTMPSSGPMNTNTQTTNDIPTKAPEVEVLETTTEDYGNIGEPECEYDPFTYILRCGLNLITSIFGLSDSCCKPLF